MDLLSLPTEILTQIFSNLTWKDILKSQNTCKAIHELCSSTPLQYHISLGIAGYEGGPSTHPIPVFQRLEMLKRVESLFSDAKFGHKVRLPLSNSYTPAYDLQGGVFLQGRHVSVESLESSGINVFRLPSLLCENDQTASWKLPDLPNPVRDFSLDPSQDLLVLVEGGMLGRSNVIVHFLSLTSGKPHPLSSGSCLIQAPYEIRGFLISIMGPFVALLCVKFKFVIFDWRTGKNLAEITFEDEDFVKSFFFVDQERLGLILGQRNPPEIEIYRINPYDDPPDMSLTAKYHLPALTTTQTLHISCNSGPSPQPVDTNSRYKGNTAYSTPPFSPRLEDKIILLELAVQTLFYHHIEYHTIIIRGETFMNVPPEADCVDGVYVIPSSLWMAQTYVERTTRTGNWACFVYGSRLVKLLPKSLTYENTEEESEVAEDAEVAPNEQYPIQDVDEEVSEEQGEEEAPEEHANFDEEQAMSWPVEVVILDVNPRLIAMAEHEDDRFGLKKPGRTIRRAEPLTLGATDWNPQLPVMETRFSPVTLNFKYSDEFVAMLDAERLMIIKLGHVDGRSRVPMYMDIYSP